MVENFRDVLALLRSPLDGSELKEADDALIDQSDNRFQYVRGLPVLIDHENSLIDSNIQYASPVKRSNRITSLKSLFGSNLHTSINCNKILNIIEISSKPKPNLLIIGGGSIGLGSSKLYGNPNCNVIAFDIYASENITFIADGHKIPIQDHTIDVVWIQAVLEHVLNPEVVVEEIERVLEQDGHVYAEVPFMQPVHEGAYDFKRYSHSGLRFLFQNFECLDSGPLDGPGTALRWTLKSLFSGLFRSNFIGKLVYHVSFFLSFLDRFIPGEYKIDSASGFYFLGRKSFRKKDLKSIVSFYKGAQI